MSDFINIWLAKEVVEWSIIAILFVVSVVFFGAANICSTAKKRKKQKELDKWLEGDKE